MVVKEPFLPTLPLLLTPVDRSIVLSDNVSSVACVHWNVQFGSKQYPLRRPKNIYHRKIELLAITYNIQPDGAAS